MSINTYMAIQEAEALRLGVFTFEDADMATETMGNFMVQVMQPKI